MSKSVILPGSYDPVTVGHLEIIREAARLYDKVFVVAFINPEKKYLFTPDERLSMLRIATEGIDGVSVDFSEGLVIDYAREKGVGEILKGYRNDADLEYEIKMAEWNKKNGGFDTELLPAREELSEVSSSRVRASLDGGVIPEEILPRAIKEYLEK